MSRTMKQLFLFAAQLGGFALNLLLLVHAQDQSGFISIDCGLGEDSRYNESSTGITYISDENFVATGERKLVLPEYIRKYSQSYNSLRSFPEGIRNCYKINVTSKTKYLIRATFLYGNYDEQNEVPEFEIHLGPNLWDTVNWLGNSKVKHTDLIHVPLRNYVHVCLVKTGSGVPFITAIALRPLTDASYNTVKGSLSLIGRRDIGLTADLRGYRYPDDIHDRIWNYLENQGAWTNLNTSSTINSEFEYQTPSVVMGTAATPKSSNDAFNIFWGSSDDTEVHHVYLHFAEVEKLQPNQSRQFNITTNGELCHGTLAPDYLSTTTIFCTAESLGGSGVQNNFSIIKTGNSTLPPILNAYEIYEVKEFLISDTNQEDVEAITNIKSTYNIEKNWQGDPCNPQVYSWDGLNCSYHANDPPRIISLNLSSSGLEGEISSSLSNLTMIQTLDLSNNNLRGSIPEFLSQMPTLNVLNLESNNLTGSIPAVLIDRWKDGFISISLCENPNLSGNVSCDKKKNRKYNFFVLMMIVSVVALSVLLLSAAAIWCRAASKRKRRLGNSTDANVAIQRKGRRFTYSEIVQITEEFKRVLGKGGFGTVYHGHIDDTQVAVKMLSPSSVQGFQQFLTEVDLLMRVHHRNLTSLVGYCNDETNIGLIYEYMANGNLREHLSGSRSNILSWGDRVQIAIEAAQGLEYLHYGCSPPIIHRDVKSTNILLNEKFEAKLSDFGISRSFPTENGTHITTTVAGTPGYLDPEYYASNRLNKESDVYSFGIVLLEIITSRPVFSRTHERSYISEWFSFMLQKGDIYSLVDPRLEGKFNINSVWKAVEIANACVSPTAIERLSMSQVVADLKECLATQLARANPRHETEIKDSIAMLHPSLR
ncbi:LRR receptor-like serine/threonine-protein kinase [Pyrus ussuriensis x Pyrus communis]|uniref:LRR receptor-like serine/threonine-protein kinase n=1 Tax=Pyrus ussuriensis x Pyrus communis TaxID=2448454 RepID=A0A5N5GHX3_9ROSA|nr:LRR receptor-like serine/threonine-protein kinase [Pyrus ussuriensis x Pyrus communis]